MRFFFIIILAILALTIAIVYFLVIPVRLPNEVKVEIPYGSSVTKAGEILKDAKIIKNEEVYVLLSHILYKKKGITAGKYVFSGNTYVLMVVYRTSNARFGGPFIKITIPEGFTNQEIINRIASNFPNLTKSEIKSKLPKLDGYIFPETYFFDTEASLDEIINKMTTVGNQKLTDILKLIDIKSAEAKRILIIASLVEAEGKNKEERKMIAGIIENRLTANMPLQLDATITYLTNHGSSQITQSDLKIDSPYNTYLYKGLPPGPINNPGAESIEAAMNPTKSDYLYYLHAPNEQIYYAKTYQEHLNNKNKYLR
ncbi:hypothetical protein A3C57_00835 [Candidatus Nomurabacteria bacterium RIFCSPHIGHO2_02_FULL_33_12]|uniref:Endolytic murein transglycosylase n=1 Tax=Candidatus Nomurabacteria bacterium RIFCSPLOWO2_01_FULL_33_17 TaxID=1801764 RepID=A0A1F6WQN4_9BACT|nr:MAG: hypothetical protein A3C57_00835 [Candidatus Nomurabacteria bacterium RIFCSPHIGHO2_02_FULL_33_12]OGI84183.1 MAG: hypothetical protein A2903_01460 [Candidatus Nomurabacteria bacterium RIFCSPLOWO2_01_FULL_33_17]